jgi:hypothetical protein
MVRQVAFQSYQELVRAVEGTPDAIRQLVDGVAPDKLTRKPGDGWSILEHVCHLRDLEQEGYTVRIDKILTLDHPFLSDVDGDKLAEQRDYNNQPFDQALQSFFAARKDNIQNLRDLSDEQLNRRARLENVGDITLARLIQLMYEHDSDHLKQLNELRDQLTHRSLADKETDS